MILTLSNFEWVAIAANDTSWILIAFVLGFGARLLKLPPLIGFLLAGFLINRLGFVADDALQKVADLGITLLLFSVGLKLNFQTLLRPQIWLVASAQSLVFVGIVGALLVFVFFNLIPYLKESGYQQALLIAFALSFSSTVFAVKSLEEKGEMRSLHGRISVGILIMQDLLAVGFIAISMAKFPSWWALALLLFFPARPLVNYLLEKSGHGELLILLGFTLALGSAELFEFTGIKGDLGALVCGALLAPLAKSRELAKAMFTFKDFFLVGFFLSIGMTGDFSPQSILIGFLLVPLIFLKSSFFFLLMTRLNLRARTSLLASLSLTNFSEFGLIVIAIGNSLNLISENWLVIFAIALSLSFIVSSIMNHYDEKIYTRFKSIFMRFEKEKRLTDDSLSDIQSASVVVFGMGRVGAGAYDRLREKYADAVIGVDFDLSTIEKHRAAGRKVLHGDPVDTDFWEKMHNGEHIELVMLALPNLQANLQVIERLKAINCNKPIAAIAKYTDEENILMEAGATEVFNFYTEIGEGFADHIEKKIEHDAHIHISKEN